MNWGTDLAGTDGFTSMTNGTRMSLATGAMSRLKSKLSLALSDALITCVTTHGRPAATHHRASLKFFGVIVLIVIRWCGST
jgi:hypothetical protein